MKKNVLWMWAAILICGTSMLTACSNDAEPGDTPVIDNLTEKLEGKWMMAETNGQPVPTDSKQVLTYVSANKFYYSLSISAISDLNVWVNQIIRMNNVAAIEMLKSLRMVIVLTERGVKRAQVPRTTSRLKRKITTTAMIS